MQGGRGEGRVGLMERSLEFDLHLFMPLFVVNKMNKRNK